jgi:hypothetical protein
MDDHLPTDGEFLDSLFVAPSSNYNPTNDPSFLRECVEVFLRNNVIPTGKDPENFVKEMFDPRHSFRGFYSDCLVNEARQALPAPHHYLFDTPLGFLHLEELNGFAIRTPRGNAAIILNKGVLLHAHLLGRCMLALTTWGAPEPFCSDHQPAAFAHAIVCLGRFVLCNDYEHLRKITVWNCPSIDPWDLQSAKISVAVQTFVLLHELGHVFHGHLDSSLVAPKYGLQVYLQNHVQEHEADRYAFHALMNRFGEDMSAIVAALLFGFFDLIDHLSFGAPISSPTHPAGRDRWSHLKKEFDLKDPQGQRFGRVDSMFELVVRLRDDLG